MLDRRITPGAGMEFCHHTRHDAAPGSYQGTYYANRIAPDGTGLGRSQRGGRDRSRYSVVLRRPAVAFFRARCGSSRTEPGHYAARSFFSNPER
jgi:hypothetical protein